MIGAGFIKDMNARLKSNRSLLKGDGSGKYSNFDKSYITDFPIGEKRKAPSYRKATTEYMRALKGSLSQDNEKEKGRIIMRATLALIITFVLISASLALFSYWFL